MTNQRAQIELFCLPHRAKNLKLDILVRPINYGDSYTAPDREATEKFWQELAEESARFGRPQSTTSKNLATLRTVGEDGKVICNTTEFKDYVAISRVPDRLSSEACNGMRVAAVGACLLSADDSIIVHKRSTKATHSPGYLDSSCAGLCFVKDGRTLRPEEDLPKKLKGELGLEMKDIEEITLTGIHSCSAPDFSGMFTYALRTGLDQDKVRSSVDKAMQTAGVGRLDSYEFVQRTSLVDYLLRHYITDKDMVADGLVTLMGALNEDEFSHVQSRVKDTGISLAVGPLQ